jgi:hypothetical protein
MMVGNIYHIFPIKINDIIIRYPSKSFLNVFLVKLSINKKIGIKNTSQRNEILKGVFTEIERLEKIKIIKRQCLSNLPLKYLS